MLDGERRCPCKSGRKYKRCCRPWHQGRPAPDPESLMRSRFSAYALGMVDYIVQTTDPAGPMWQADLATWQAEIRDFCTRTSFRDLQVRSATQDTDADGAVTGTVDFRCVLAVGDEEARVGEISRFTRANGAWLYHSGQST